MYALIRLDGRSSPEWVISAREMSPMWLGYRRKPRHQQAPRCPAGTALNRESPAAFAPLLDVRALGPQRRVAAVAGIDPGLVGQPAEQLGVDVVDQRGEPRRVLLRVADAAGEQAVAGEQVRAVRAQVKQRDRAGGVADEVDN